MKKFVSLLALLCLPLLANAEKVQIDGIWYNLIEKVKQAEVTSSDDETKYTGEVVIPETVTYGDIEYDVKSIKESAFQGCSSLTSITIPNSVTSIGEVAFWNCSSLTDIVIPNSITRIEAETFGNCTSLTNITIPNSVTDIERQVFWDCSSLVNVVIPNSVTQIKYGTFYGCSALTSITIPNSVTSIGGVAFRGCSSLENISIPNSVTYIDGRAFEKCSKLGAITIPDSVTSVSDYTFYDCSNLTTVVIGISVNKISSKAFGNCKNLTDFYCHAKIVPSTNQDAFTDSYIEYATLHVPDSSYYDYKEAEVWTDFGTITTLSGNIPAFTHNLIYMVDGMEYKRYEVDYGTVIIAETVPTKEGYTFGGWTNLPKTMPLHDVTVNGIYTPNTYTLTYTVDGVEYKTYNVTYGETITPETLPIKEGYEFDGWSEIPETMPAHDVTITGSFTPLAPCVMPTINYQDGKLTFVCETEGAECVANITCEDIQEHHGNEVLLTSTYQVNVYAKAEGYANSETATATLCWIECTEEHEDEEGNGVINIPSTPVLIQSQTGAIIVNGLTDDTLVSVYSIDGKEVGCATTVNGVASISTTLQAGDVAIVKVGAKSVKIIMK